ncbi:MAG: hypothetical protein K8F91_04805, partial [Candidatus Obscuribacterales bacterium]|nr:hypothetical protein [Candidatus Obscuribacterales bacterium]
MRTPNWGPRTNELDSKQPGTSPDLAPLYGRMGLCLGILGGLIFFYNWLMSDISGIYSYGNGGSLIELCLVRKTTSFTGTLKLGTMTSLVLTDTEPPDSDEISLHFQTPQDQIEAGERNKIVDMIGTLKNGKFEGVVSYGGKSRKVEIERD